jgi:hypothetical protein
MSQCSHEGCKYFAGPSGFCSSHTQEGKARFAARELEIQAEEARKLQELRDGARWWADNRVRYPAGYNPKSLVLGASPTEERSGRTHYDDKDVFLLGQEDHHDAPRYIQANYTPGLADKKLEAASNTYENFFDEIAFDGSTMCSFGVSSGLMVPIFTFFYKMLKERGVFFLYEDTPNIQTALEVTGFLVRRVKVVDLRGTIVRTLGFNDNTPVLVAIKRPAGGAAAPHPLYGAQGGRRKARKTRKKSSRRKRQAKN